jgi:serine/threonine protein kinase
MMTECPSADTLSRYAIGDLDDATSDDLERHLATCPNCEDSLAGFDSAEDSLIRHLPLAAATAPPAASDSPGWLAQLRNGPVELSVSDSQSPVAPISGSPAEFSSYELLGILGRGGMGVVYRARHRQLHRLVALKVLSPRLMATSEARRRFEREIRILGGLHHPGIVMATDANRIDGAAYLVMELIDGVDLARLVRTSGALSVPEACEAGRQIADALSAAHQTGTIHRDIKPSNVMVDHSGRIKLLDFGLAHLSEFSAESLDTSLGRLLGTLDYMAPEQADCERPLDARVDLLGLGATLF